MSEEKRTCSFCGKSENDVKNLIEGEHAFICNECVETCGLMLQDNESGEIENEFAKVKEEIEGASLTASTQNETASTLEAL